MNKQGRNPACCRQHFGSRGNIQIRCVHHIELIQQNRFIIFLSPAPDSWPSSNGFLHHGSYNKTNQMHWFLSYIYIWNKTLHVSGHFLCPSSGVSHCTHSNTDADSLRAVSKTIWRIPPLCVQWKTPDDGQRDCPRHVEFYSKNKFEKLVHIVGFIIKIYHDARSPEHKKSRSYI